MTNEIEARLSGDLLTYNQKLLATSLSLPNGAVIVPNAHNIVDVEYLQATPRRTRRNTTFTDVVSFLSYYERFKDAGTPITFAATKEEGILITTVFDYDTSTNAAWGDHTATLDLAFHHDFLPFKDRNNKLIPQAEFAEFVEDYLPVFVNPDGATMLELVSDLRGAKNVQFGKSVRLDNGAVKFEYKEILEAGGVGAAGDIRIPEKFILGAALFSHGAPLEFTAAFRYRVDTAGNISFGFKLLRLKETIEKAVELIIAQIENSINEKVLHISQRGDESPSEADVTSL